MDARLVAYIARLPAESSRRADPLAGTASPAASFVKQLRSAGLLVRLGALLGAHAMATALFIASWWFIGSAVLSGRFDNGWLTAWALCLMTMVPLRVAAKWWEGVVSVGFGGLMKQRLLAGALSIDAEIVRRKGVGQLLGEVLEAEAIEQLGTSGGLETMVAAVELMAVPLMLAWGAAASVETVVLLVCAAAGAVLITRNVRRRSEWTRLRLGLTHQLVERMSGHRTRVAQQPEADWHRDEDGEHEEYASASRVLDRSTAWIEAALPRGYVVVALAALTPSFVSGAPALPQLAITFGAILFAGDALHRFTFGLARVAPAWIAWQAVKPTFEAAGRVAADGSTSHHSAPAPRAGAPLTAPAVLQARDVVFTHQARVEPAVKGVTMTIERGDSVLLEGGSGSGKSTVVSLIAGLRKPASGVVLAGGLDLHTLGERAWRRRVAVAPQYHENHVLSAPLGFNLLLGRPYPHSAGDLQDAREICDELGLGPLVDRMPSGLDQMVGETGWQLSQGERSRVFLARALLQRAELTVLDETLAALDPENLRQCLECVLRRTESLLLVAHP